MSPGPRSEPLSEPLPEPLSELLSGYRPRDPGEAADLARVLELVLGRANPWGRDSPLHLTASALIVHPDSRRVLLRWHQRQQAWLQVGGHADAGEDDPLRIALREGEEETGLSDLRPWPDPGLLHLAIVPVPARGPDDPAHEHADLRFVLATAAPDSARPEHPGADLRWLSLPDALATSTEDNLRESLLRLQARFGG